MAIVVEHDKRKAEILIKVKLSAFSIIFRQILHK